MHTLTKPNPTPLSEDDARLAQDSTRALKRLMGDEGMPVRLTLRLSVEGVNGEKAEHTVPEAALPLLYSLFRGLSQGKGVSVLTEDAEMTTQQAADFLHVSRPYVVKLLNQGKIPYRKIGVRRRVRLEDVLHFMDDTGDAASQALDELAVENQRLGLYP